MTAGVHGPVTRRTAGAGRPPRDHGTPGDRGRQPRLHLVLPVPVRAAVRGAAVPLVRRVRRERLASRTTAARSATSRRTSSGAKITGLALAIDLAVSLPAAYALVRYPVPGRRIIFSILQLSLYVPGAVIGLALC